MDTKGSDKTRIKNPQKEHSDATDKTRVAPHRSTKTTKQESDKTRIAPPKPHQQPVDKTRLKPGAQQRARQDREVTRFKPRKSKPVDKTRVSPNSQSFPKKLEEESSASVVSGAILKDRFVLEEVLGAGGMGVVYKAKDLLKVEAQDRDPYVAIKVLSEEFKTHPEAFISLQRESRKTQRIAHPNIVNVYDFDRDNDTVFMTMEYLDGSPLDELISKYQTTGLPTDDCWEILAGMTAALGHAHAEHIIHSDFKPGNVFVTHKGIAKVFDFGIARAVARVEQLEDITDDKTIFDAGNLGALTPAYASLEMLEGEEPDVRDDIYALGCVAYEMLTGQHPYNKVPADEAERQGLKAKRISHIKKYQWRAIENAIAFRREDRTVSIPEFLAQLTPKLKTANRWITVFAFVSLALAAVYYNFYLQQTAEPVLSEFDIRNEVELKVRIDFQKEKIQSLIAEAAFSPVWESSLWKEISDLSAITKTEDNWIEQQKSVIYELYLARIRQHNSQKAYSVALALIGNAKRYTADVALLEAMEKDIVLTQEKEKNRKKMLALEQQKKRQALLKKQREQDKLIQTEAQQKQQVAQKKQQFDVALENVNNQLKCSGQLNMRNIETAVNKLKQLDRARYQRLQPDVIKSLASCITSVGRAFPEKAREARKQSLRIFDSNPLLAAIVIKARDPCDLSLAGLGARGKRAICKDSLKVAGSGPELVVIPGNNNIDAFAIAKYETTINDFNLFCNHAPQCKKINGEGDLPVSEIDLKLVRAYLKWLSTQSEQKYRLPTKKEWIYAAKSRRKMLDPNRNCELITRGFQKGGELLNARIGKQNSWGLVNYVGNVQEWVYDSARKLVAVGGSYRQTMEKCDINTTLSHDGKADKLTGFRVLREIQG